MLEKEEFSFQGRKTKKKMEQSFWEKEEFWFVKKDDKEKLLKKCFFRDLPTDTRHCYALENRDGHAVSVYAVSFR